MSFDCVLMRPDACFHCRRGMERGSVISAHRSTLASLCPISEQDALVRRDSVVPKRQPLAEHRPRARDRRASGEALV